MSNLEPEGRVLRRVAASRRKSERFYKKNNVDNKEQPGKEENVSSTWIDNSFMSNGDKPKVSPPSKNKDDGPSGMSTPKRKPVITPQTPDLFGDSFNDTDPFLANIDIAAIEEKASQDPHSQTEHTVPLKNPTTSRKRKSSQSQESIKIPHSSLKESDFFIGSDSDDGFISKIDVLKLTQKADKVLLDTKVIIDNSQTKDCGDSKTSHVSLSKAKANASERTLLDNLSDSTDNARQGNSSHENKVISKKVNQSTSGSLNNHKNRLISGNVDQSTTLSNVGQSTTPGSSRLNRLKKQLQKNASTPQNPTRREQVFRKEELENALKDAQAIKSEGSEFDIGPFYGLPSQVQKLFEELRGITKFYEWQEECLSLPVVQQGGNLIYSLPTSGGKTLVAEILLLRQLLGRKKDVLFVLPFVSIVQEKVRGLSKFAVELDFLVEEYAASKGAFPPRKRHKRKSVYIATIEKANSLVNSLLEEGRLDELGLVIVDELHMLGEGGSRGATLEMCLSKLLHATTSTQIIAMSATLSNIDDLAAFLRAKVYSNDFRPVELIEYVKVNDTIYEIQPRALCPEDRLKHSRVVTFKYDKTVTQQDPDHLAGLVSEVVPKHSCLVFCPTKKNCENVAMLLTRLLPKELSDVKVPERRAVLRQLVSDGAGEVCPVLRRTVPLGIAYHHSGLTMDERRLLEEAYLEGTLNVLCCTSTLAAGVNLPAKRVILRSPYVGASFLSRSQYKQMVGRAGRAGLDSSGESIVIMQTKDKQKLLDLVSGPFEHCRSSLLYENSKGMRAMMLTTVGLKNWKQQNLYLVETAQCEGMVEGEAARYEQTLPTPSPSIRPVKTAGTQRLTPCPASVAAFLQNTLCHVQTSSTDQSPAAGDTDLAKLATTALQQLHDLGLIAQKRSRSQDKVNAEDEVDGGNVNIEVTNLGRAVFKGSVDIDRGRQLYGDLCAGREALCVANYLHLLYLVTPYDMVVQVKPNWMTYLDELSRLGPSEQSVASAVGVSEAYVAKKASGQRVRKGIDEFPFCRFYLTLMLYRLWQQQSIWHVAAKFQLGRGFVQQLLTGAAAFAACITHFCKELEEFWAYQDLLANFVKRLTYCVTMDLIPLMEIPGVKLGRARQLYNAGFKSLPLVAHAEAALLVKNIEHLNTRNANQIIAAAQMLVNERAEALREEAEDMITVPSAMPVTKETTDNLATSSQSSLTSIGTDSQLDRDLAAQPDSPASNASSILL